MPPSRAAVSKKLNKMLLTRRRIIASAIVTSTSDQHRQPHDRDAIERRPRESRNSAISRARLMRPWAGPVAAPR